MDGFGNVFNDYSENYIFSRGVKGDPGVGFNLTINGDYDMQNKRLCNVSEPKDDTNVCTKGYVSEMIKGYENNIQNSIQTVDNKHYSETSRLNTALIQFSDSTDTIIKLKDQKIKDVETKLDTNIGELLDLQRATTISIPTLINNKINDIHGYVLVNLYYDRCDKKGFYILANNYGDVTDYVMPNNGLIELETCYPAGGYKEMYINNKTFKHTPLEYPLKKGETIKFMKRDDLGIAPIHIELLISYGF